MKKAFLVMSTGFALFAMFFGSGNLVFPIAVGTQSEGHVIWASLGILLTGVLVPFLGVLGMMLFQGNIRDFFNCFGKKGVFIFSLIALSLMGPFGVLARCLTVAHGALVLLLPNISLPIASLALCAIIFLLTMRKNRIVTILGSILTPFLLLAIVAIAFFGLWEGEFSPSSAVGSWPAFKTGFFQGYQTMDLLAAFFFSGFIITYLNDRFPDSHKDRSSLKVFAKAALVGAGLLSFVYVALVVLGWIYHTPLTVIPPQEMLGAIALSALGSFAAPCVCLAVIFACLTTAIVLTSLFADFARTEVFRNKIGNAAAILLTLGIGFLVSTLEFSGIAKFIGPVLETIYPALIALTIVNISNKFWGIKATHWPFTLIILVKIFAFR
ncbi:MAG TPA: branched-chain amino acid transport system II carrier protein [Rhabdochlamydiaceae bacterium]|jgi:LIVCS family branched-chain amino acid:cation transporter